MGNTIKSGKEVLPYLAEIYQQLYLIPGPEAEKEYPEIVQSGQSAGSKDLSHFRMNEKDSLELEETPAGSVQVVTLHERQDFERFMQIMANRCAPVEIPATQGASILDGVINWKKIRDHKDQFYRERIQEGEYLPDWPEEFRRFTSVKSNYTDALIVLSTGPYSNISADALGLDPAMWLERSYAIRKFHECTHFLCRRKYPDQIDPIWDEVIADAVGIYGAFGKYDPEMADVFLGVTDSGYTGGRLENYVKDKEELPEIARRVQDVIRKISSLEQEHRGLAPFDMAVLLEEQKKEWWG